MTSERDSGPQFVHYIPIVTTALCVPFAREIYRRYRAHPERLHLLWWSLGILTYGVGTFTEATTTLVGWREPIFRAWYISGALLGGAPLAQGTVYLLLVETNRARADRGCCVSYVAVASVAVHPVTDSVRAGRAASTVGPGPRLAVGAVLQPGRQPLRRRSS